MRDQLFSDKTVRWAEKEIAKRLAAPAPGTESARRELVRVQAGTPTEKPQVRLTIVLGSPGSAHDERIDILGTAESKMPTRAGHPGRAR